jgi:hypothetical protein
MQTPRPLQGEWPKGILGLHSVVVPGLEDAGGDSEDFHKKDIAV